MTTFFNYNEQEQLVGFEYNKQQYFYVRDLLGNIRNIIDKNGSVVVTFRYDAWGNHRVLNSNGTENNNPNFIGNINPFRYKGYYYDQETHWYYLNSRYYDAVLSRFISIDSIEYLDPEDTRTANLFAYCTNNPVMYLDPSGTSPLKWYHWFAIAVGAALVLTGVGVLIAGAASATFAGTLISSVAIGAAQGALIGAAIGTGVGDKGMWKINQVFLKQQMALNRTFVLSSDYSTTSLTKEIGYLLSKGIMPFLI